MSSYPGRPLPLEGDNIRLLYLLPSKDEAAPLQCELHNYSLQQSGPRTHLYEALSYVWGDSTRPLPKFIFIDTYQLPVTVNLHAALSRLRDPSLQRIIWVDAVCINQEDLNEQGQQVQLMAKVYSNAHRVIVWLGEDTEGALEDIRLAANGELERSKNEINQQAILKLLQKPWFQRIWVLQEVAAARHVMMMCDSMEIDGYAFCLGLKSLKLSYTASELRSVPSVTNLIERAGLRSKYTANLPERFSLKICSLAELIDMFHTRGASKICDKVHALLGMSSDDPGLQPGYTVSWEEQFRQLVEFILGKDASVETSDNSQRAVIKSKGCVLGQVSSVNDDSQKVNITSKNAAWYSGDKEWTFQASAKSIQEHDIVCFLQGASKPTIIRLCKDHFAIVVIAATPLKESGSLGQLVPSKSITHFPRDFLLVWDWENPLGELTETNSRVLEQPKAELKGHLEKATRKWDVAIILDDLEEYEKADERLQEATEDYETAFGVDHPYKLKGQYGRTPLSWAAGNGYDMIVNSLLAKDNIDPDLKDSRSDRTPLSWAIEGGHEAMVKLLLETGKVDVESKDKNGWTPLSYAAKNGNKMMVELLIEKGAELEIIANYGWRYLEIAAQYGNEAVVKLLLEKGVVSYTLSGRSSLSWAAENGHEAVVKLLLEKESDLIIVGPVEQTPLSYAAKNGHKAVVKLLLETSPEVEFFHDCKEKLLIAAQYGFEAVVKLQLEKGIELETRDSNCWTPLLWAAKNGHEAVVKLLLKKGANLETQFEYWRTPLSWAAENGHEVVVKLLLNKGAKPKTKDYYGKTPLSYAEENGHEEVVKLLLKKGTKRR